MLWIAFAIGLAACPFSGKAGGDGRGCPHHTRARPRRLSEAGLLNEGKGCWGLCNKTAGNCTYCGTGQCCRQTDYSFGVPGCELAKDVVGARCGLWQGDPSAVGLKNEGLACLGHCNNIPGEGCVYCGAGQCCRKSDADRCLPGCEGAGTIGLPPAPQSQCGHWAIHDDAAVDPFSCVPASSARCS